MSQEFHVTAKMKPETINTVILLFIILFSFIVFSNSLKNDFINWDDDKLVYENNYVTQFPHEGFSVFLSPDILWRDPLTIVSQAVIYYFWDRDPMPFHLVNLFIHLLNVFLVFIIVKNLTKQLFVASIVAVLFAVHPFRVESVAWVSERKDVLYGCFYLLGLLSYIFYLKSGLKKKYLFFTFALAILSFSSKTAAVSLPVVLFLFDYYAGRKLSYQSVREKIPLVLIIVIFSLLLFNPGLQSKYIPELVTIPDVADAENFFNYTFADRIFMGTYSFLFYIIGFIAPANLSLIHYYPVKIQSLPVIYYISFFVFTGLILFLFFVIKKFKNIRKDLIFGLLFFIFTIAVVMHIIPIKGVSVVAERYTYVAYFGLFFIIGRVSSLVFDEKFKRANKYRYAILLLLFVYVAVLSIVSWNRIKDWKDSIAIFTDVIEKNHNIPFAYNNRGNARLEKKDYYGAIADHNRSIRLSPGNPDPWYNRGCVKLQLKNYKGAIADFDKSIDLSERFTRAFINRGLTKSYIKDYTGAVRDFEEVLKYDKKNIYALYNRGRVRMYLKQNELAKNDFTEVIKINPSDVMSHFYKATAESDYKTAVKDYDKTIELFQNFPEAYYNRGIAKKMIKDYYGALSDLNIAIELKLKNISDNSNINNLRMPMEDGSLNFKQTQNKAFAYYNRGRVNFYLGNYANVLKDMTESIHFNSGNWDAYLYRGMAKAKVKDYVAALEDFNKVLVLNTEKVDALFERGNIFFILHEYEKAVNDYNAAIKIKPDAKLYSNRGNVKFQLKDYASSIIDYNEAIALEPENADYFFNRGISKYYLKQKTGACSDFQKAAGSGHAKAKEALSKFCK